MKEVFSSILPYAQLIVSLFLVLAIIMQQTGASLGGAFGSDNFSSGFHTRRGAEKLLFNITLFLAVVFVLLAIADVFFLV